MMAWSPRSRTSKPGSRRPVDSIDRRPREKRFNGPGHESFSSSLIDPAETRTRLSLALRHAPRDRSMGSFSSMIPSLSAVFPPWRALSTHRLAKSTDSAQI